MDLIQNQPITNSSTKSRGIALLLSTLFIFNDTVVIRVVSTNSFEYVLAFMIIFLLQKIFFLYHHARSSKWSTIILEFLDLNILVTALSSSSSSSQHQQHVLESEQQQHPPPPPNQPVLPQQQQQIQPHTSNQSQHLLQMSYYTRAFLHMYTILFILVGKSSAFYIVSPTDQLLILSCIALATITVTAIIIEQGAGCSKTGGGGPFDIRCAFPLRWLTQLGLLSSIVLVLCNDAKGATLIYFLFKLILLLILYRFTFTAPAHTLFKRYALFAVSFFICVDHGPFYSFRIFSPQQQHSNLNKKSQSTNLAANMNPVEEHHNQPEQQYPIGQPQQQQQQQQQQKEHKYNAIYQSEIALCSSHLIRINAFYQILDWLLLLILDYSTSDIGLDTDDIMDFEADSNSCSSDSSNCSSNNNNSNDSSSRSLNYRTRQNLRMLSSVALAILITAFLINQLLYLIAEYTHSHIAISKSNMTLNSIMKFLQKNTRLRSFDATVCEIDMKCMINTDSANQSIQELIDSIFRLSAFNAVSQDHHLQKHLKSKGIRIPPTNNKYSSDENNSCENFKDNVQEQQKKKQQKRSMIPLEIRVHDVRNQSFIILENTRCQIDCVMHEFLVAAIKHAKASPYLSIEYVSESTVSQKQVEELVEALNYRVISTAPLNFISVRINGKQITCDPKLQAQAASITAYHKFIANDQWFDPHQILFDLYEESFSS